MEISESFNSYKCDIEKSLSKLETEINSISMTLEGIDLKKNDKIESLIKESENNVIKINKFVIYNRCFTFGLNSLNFFITNS